MFAELSQLPAVSGTGEEMPHMQTLFIMSANYVNTTLALITDAQYIALSVQDLNCPVQSYFP